MIIDNNQIKAMTKEDTDLLFLTALVLMNRLNGGDNTVLEYIELIIQRLDDLESHTYATKLQETLDFYGSIEDEDEMEGE